MSDLVENPEYSFVVTRLKLPSAADLMINARHCWKAGRRGLINDRHKTLVVFERRHEKTGFLHMRKQRRRSACGNREADQRLCFRYTDSTIPLLPKYEIISLLPCSVTVQPGLCWTWSETPKTGFLTTRLI